MRETSLAPLTSRGWLATQPEAFRQWIADNGRWVHYSAGHLIYQAGDDPDGLYGLGEGALEITLPLTGEEPVTIYRAEPGFWIGESALLARTTRLITLEAAAASRVFRIPATAIRALVAERPEHWRPFFELSHLNATTSVILLGEALALTPRARLARMLLRLADHGGKVTARQDELARLIGMTRSSLQRALHSLGDAGAISGGYGCTLIRDRACLERISTEA